MSLTPKKSILAPGIALALAAGGLFAEPYLIDWFTADGGGGTLSSGSAYSLDGTIGQPDACNCPEPMSGGPYTLTAGFWVIPACRPVPADFDGDCDVDQGDGDHFSACVTGATIHQDDPDCANADLDHDGDVDPSDFGLFQRCYAGTDHPIDPSCIE